jgi:hypothetical protein
MTNYDVGDLPLVFVTFKDVDGNVGDPTDVNLVYRKPDGVVETVPLGSLTHTTPGSGYYEYALPLTMAGIWYGEWRGTGVITAVEQFTLVVRTSFAPTYDVSTDEGKVRLLCQDFDMENPIFADAEISAFLALNGSNVKLAAAQALDVIAANEVYIQKRIKLLDLWTNGPSEATELRQIAKELRRQVTEGEGELVGDFFDIAEMVFDDFTAREYVENLVLRES